MSDRIPHIPNIIATSKLKYHQIIFNFQVGIEDSLHIEFEYNKARYHLDEAIIGFDILLILYRLYTTICLGKISFILVRVKIKYMEVDIIRREQTGNGPSTYTETDSIGKYEIMDGGPIKGEVIPIRLFLKAFQAQPTMKVKYK